MLRRQSRQLAQRLQHHRLINRVLRFEIEIQSSLGQLRDPRDILHARRLQPLAGKDFRRRSQYLGAPKLGHHLLLAICRSLGHSHIRPGTSIDGRAFPSPENEPE